jgi:hypothetical protein
MFTAGIVASLAYVALPVARFISAETAEGMLTPPGHRAGVAVMRIIAVIDVAVEAMRAVEPRAGADEDSVCEPIRTIVAVGGTVIRRIVEVSVRAARGPANADADADLSWGVSGECAKEASNAQQGECSKKGECSKNSHVHLGIKSMPIEMDAIGAANERRRVKF